MKVLVRFVVVAAAVWGLLIGVSQGVRLAPGWSLGLLRLRLLGNVGRLNLNLGRLGVHLHLGRLGVHLHRLGLRGLGPNDHPLSGCGEGKRCGEQGGKEKSLHRHWSTRVGGLGVDVDPACGFRSLARSGGSGQSRVASVFGRLAKCTRPGDFAFPERTALEENRSTIRTPRHGAVPLRIRTEAVPL